MAFTDYLDLRTAVLEQVGDTSLSDVFDRLTKLAEARLNRELRLSDQITETTLTISGGSAALPSDFLEMIGVYNGSGYEYVAQPSQANRTTGPQSYYGIEGGNLVTKGPDGDRTIQYYAAIPTLTTSLTTTNWLLAKYPAVYLYAVAFEAAKHKRDAELAGQMGGLMNDEISAARADDDRKRYARARVRVQGVNP